MGKGPKKYKCIVCTHKTTTPLEIVRDPVYQQCICSKRCKDDHRREKPWKGLITSRWRE